MMGLDFSATTKQNQEQEYTIKSLTWGIMKKKKSEHKFVVTSKKLWRATRKVTLSSNESERKSQIGINPLNKQEKNKE